MNFFTKSFFYAVVLSLTVFLVSCGETDKQATVTPPPTNTPVDIANINSLAGNYKIKSFTAMGNVMNSNNYIQIQDLVGQSVIKVNGTKVQMTSKIQLESYFLDATKGNKKSDLSSFTNQYLESKELEAKAVTGKITTELPANKPVDNMTFTYANNILTANITTTVSLSGNPTDVPITIELEKVNDAIIPLDKTTKYWNVKPFSTADAGTAMATYLSYYRISSIKFTDASGNVTDNGTPTFAGNMLMSLNMNGLIINFQYKWEDQANKDTKLQFQSGTGTFKLDEKKLPAYLDNMSLAFKDAGATATGEYTLIVPLSATSAIKIPAELALTGNEKVELTLTKLYDQSPDYPKVLEATKKYFAPVVPQP